jgi:hypothetical protein
LAQPCAKIAAVRVWLDHGFLEAMTRRCWRFAGLFVTTDRRGGATN